MTTKNYALLILFFFILTSGFSQEKTKKELKEERKLEKQKQIDSLVSSKEFVFVGTFAYPLGYKSVNLASIQNFMRFYPDSIDSDMPFFGRAYNVEYGGGSGLKFAGKAEDYTMKMTKKNCEIKVTVKGERDVFNIFLSVSFSGSASLSINSNNRSSISYSGDISAIVKRN
jgi:hypothetical protein